MDRPTSARQVQTGVALVTQTGDAVGRIVDGVAQVSALVSSIAVAAGEQASGLQQVNTAVSGMDGATQQNAAMVEQATAAARRLAEEAASLAGEVARFETTATRVPARHPDVSRRARAYAA
ncbi:MAG TPA: methyl-accepting chemotaxis protein [Sphingomonas sp.]|jgi:methyl-accepting chemotaxis protein|nr:methyl-accepting chemotaxis protein [Sphingomonas sp.]